MAKKVAADKVELKTPISKKEEFPIKLTQAVNEEILPLDEPPIENNVEEILQDIIPISVEEFVLENILNSVDSLQTIERGKLDLVKELILNSQNLEAISLLKSIQTAENYKVNEIISKL